MFCLARIIPVPTVLCLFCGVFELQYAFVRVILSRSLLFLFSFLSDVIPSPFDVSYHQLSRMLVWKNALYFREVCMECECTDTLAM